MIKEYEVYSDERYDRHQGSSFLLLGGVVLTDRGRSRLLTRLSELRMEFGLMREMRWGKVSSKFLQEYRAWVSAFFDDPHARLSVLVANCSASDWQKFRPRPGRRPRRDDRLASLFYQFLLVTFGPIRDSRRWWVFPDAGFFSREETLDRVEFLFNRTYKRAHGPKSTRVIRLARSLDSKRSDLVQLADILLACAACEELGNQPESQARRQLMRHFSERRERTPNTERKLQRIAVREWVPPERFEYPR